MLAAIVRKAFTIIINLLIKKTMTTEAAFKIGDIIVLKSGGPSMTIEKFPWNPTKNEYYSDRVECVWFDKDTLKRDTFNTPTLELK